MRKLGFLLVLALALALGTLPIPLSVIPDKLPDEP
jgi:hypothetical protein